MTALVFCVVLALAWLHYATAGVMLTTSITIYVAAFVAVLATGVTYALASRSLRSIAAAVVLVLNFAGSHYAWQTADPLLVSAVLDLATAAYFVLFGATRWELTIGGIYLASVLAAALANYGLVADNTTRGSGFIELSYPDFAALLGHAASITLGAGAGDAGERIRTTLQVRPVVAALRRSAAARLAALAKVGARRRS